MLATILLGIGGVFIFFQLIQYITWMTCDPTFDGQVVLITGGSSGIGEQMAKDFVRKGASKVIIAARRVEEMERVKRECERPDAIQIW